MSRLPPAPAPFIRPLMAPSQPRLSLSIVVPTYRRANSLGRLVDALMPQIGSRPDRELIIVNDGGHDAGYDSAIARHRAGLTYLVAARNGGPGAARNLGAKAAKGDFLVFIDDDCVAPPDWLDTLATILADHPEFDAVGGQTQPLISARPGFFERLLIEAGCYPNPIYYDGFLIVMVSACLAVRRSVFDRLGGFDERLVLAAEDRNLTTRLRLARTTLAIAPLWFVFHDMAATPRQHFRRFFNYGRGVSLAIAVEAQALDRTYWPPNHRRSRYWLQRARARFLAARRLVRTPPGIFGALAVFLLTATNLTMDAGYAVAERRRARRD